MAGIPGMSGLPHKRLPVGDTVKADICDDHLVGQLFIEEYIARGQVLVDNVSCVQVSHPLGEKERSKRSWNKYFESKKKLLGRPGASKHEAFTVTPVILLFSVCDNGCEQVVPFSVTVR